jgi:nitroreductase
MDVKKVIEKRRAYRSLDKAEIAEEMLRDLAHCAQIAPSCFNYQPWRFIFVHDKDTLKELHGALSRGNEWAKAASLIVVVYSAKEDDCVIRDREYYLFDTGMATAFIILRATELGFVAHPIAGYSPKKVKEILGIPTDRMVITLVIVGSHAKEISPVLSEKQREAEKERPLRKSLEKIISMNRYKNRENSE